MDNQGQVAEPTEQRQPYSPLVLRLAEEFEVDLTTIRGTGPGGRVTRADVQAVIESRTDDPEPAPQQPAPEPADQPESEADSEARADSEAQADSEIQAEAEASFSMTFEVDVTRLLDDLWRLEEEAGEVLPVEAMYVCLAVPALTRFPAVNAHLVDGALAPAPDIDIVVDHLTPLEEGPTSPSVRLAGADRLSLVELASVVNEAATPPAPEARTPAPTEELARTFTIVNVGSLGAASATPPLPPNTAAAVAYGRPRLQLQLVDGHPREQALLTLVGTFARRAVSPSLAGQFLSCLATHLQDPILAFALAPAHPPGDQP